MIFTGLPEIGMHAITFQAIGNPGIFREMKETFDEIVNYLINITGIALINVFHDHPFRYNQ
jgi:hypothetical protein